MFGVPLGVEALLRIGVVPAGVDALVRVGSLLRVDALLRVDSVARAEALARVEVLAKVDVVPTRIGVELAGVDDALIGVDALLRAATLLLEIDELVVLCSLDAAPSKLIQANEIALVVSVEPP